jgi:hypothetical protein
MERREGESLFIRLLSLLSGRKPYQESPRLLASSCQPLQEALRQLFITTHRRGVIYPPFHLFLGLLRSFRPIPFRVFLLVGIFYGRRQ